MRVCWHASTSLLTVFPALSPLALLVIIGMAAAAAVSILPRPASTRELVRKTLAHTNSEILKLYVSVIEAYMVVEHERPGLEGSRSLEGQQARETERSDVALASFRSRYIATQAALAQVGQNIALASLDLAPRGYWPKDKYSQLFTAQARILESLAQLYASLIGMSLEWKREFAQNTSILNPGELSALFTVSRNQRPRANSLLRCHNSHPPPFRSSLLSATIGDVTVALTLITTSLNTGSPLPHAGTGLVLERVVHRETLLKRMKEELRKKQGTDSPFSKDVLSLSTLRDPQYMTHVCGTMALFNMLKKIDECSAVVAALVGEHHIPGFDDLKDRFEDRWSKAA